MRATSSTRYEAYADSPYSGRAACEQNLLHWRRTTHCTQGYLVFPHRGTTCAIIGPSGSGKTTLLGLCADLDRPSSGTVILHGHSLHLLREGALAALRNTYVGFVFQTFQLIP